MVKVSIIKALINNSNNSEILKKKKKYGCIFVSLKM